MSFPVKPPPSIDRLRELFSYDPVTGLFTRLIRCGQSRFSAGSIAGAKHPRNGYIRVYVDGRYYLAHRLAWFMVYGTWPDTLDHINRVRSDNPIANLRLATPTLNALNRKTRVDNRAGVTGVFRCNDSRLSPWRDHISVNRKLIGLGSFETKEQAVAARNAAFQAEIDRRLIKDAEGYHNAAAA
jgi:HNH endonuclease